MKIQCQQGLAAQTKEVLRGSTSSAMSRMKSPNNNNFQKVMRFRAYNDNHFYSAILTVYFVFKRSLQEISPCKSEKKNMYQFFIIQNHLLYNML